MLSDILNGKQQRFKLKNMELGNNWLFSVSYLLFLIKLIYSINISFKMINLSSGAPKDQVRGLVLEVPGGQVLLPPRNVPRRRKDVQVGSETAGNDRRFPPLVKGEGQKPEHWT